MFYKRYSQFVLVLGYELQLNWEKNLFLILIAYRMAWFFFFEISFHHLLGGSNLMECLFE